MEIPNGGSVSFMTSLLLSLEYLTQSHITDYLNIVGDETKIV